MSSAFALDETQRNVRAKRPDDLETLKTIEALLQAVPEPDPVLVKWAGEQVPMKDAPILAAAVAAQADMLVTGDRRHFGAFYGLTLKKVRVLTPRDALEELFEMDALTDPPAAMIQSKLAQHAGTCATSIGRAWYRGEETDMLLSALRNLRHGYDQ